MPRAVGQVTLTTLGETAPVRLRPVLLLTPVLLPLTVLLAGCGADRGGSLSGEVTSTDGRVCVRQQVETLRCFDATADQLAGLTVGSCVRVDYRQARGEAGKVVATAPTTSPCASPPPS
jgi:hypothetical protein